jgi:NADH-quinone oxidoreductase subunit C
MTTPRHDDPAALERAAVSLRGALGALALSVQAGRDAVLLRADAARLPALLLRLRDGHGFNALQDMIGLDRLRTMKEGEPRFVVIYALLRFPEGLRLRVEVEVADGASLPSAVSVFRAADWAEREIFDMFGIVFEGHPGLTRIYMPDDFRGHPLRKDFPLEGEPGGI